MNGKNRMFARRWMLPALAVLAATHAASTVLAGRQKWEVSSSVTYVTGDYGSPTDSDLIYVPVTPQLNLGKVKLALTIPYLWIDTSTDVAIVDGVPQTAGTGESGRTEQGLGDVVLDAEYYLLRPGDNWTPGVDLTGDIKLPTADEDKGLGTGEFDLGFGFALYRWISRAWIGFADFEYNIVGEPSGRNFDNQVIWDVGASHRTTQVWLNSLLIEERTAISESGDDSVSVIYSSAYEFREDIDGFASLEWGLSDGAPDYSVTIGMERGF